MKVLAIVPTERDLNPGQRYRIEQWEPHLARLGVELTYSSFSFPALSRVLYEPRHHLRKAALIATAFVRQLRSVLSARRFDLVYVFREASLVGPAIIEPLIAAQGIPIVFDFDDAIFVPYKSPANGYLSFLKFFGKTAKLCSLATHVTVGNSHLKEYATRYNDEVTVVPTTVDTELYRTELRRPRTDGVPVVGWTGSYSTLQHLQTAAPVLTQLAKRHPYRLVIVGTQALDVPGVDTEFRRWKSSTEVQDLADVDIGIMPLPDNEWTRGKCGLKALQYMALGVPAVVSPVGVNEEIISDGMNGFVARTDDDWIEKLSTLMTKPELRSRLGEAARKVVEKRYSAQSIAPRVFDIFQKVVSRRFDAEIEDRPALP